MLLSLWLHFWGRGERDGVGTAATSVELFRPGAHNLPHLLQLTCLLICLLNWDSLLMRPDGGFRNDPSHPTPTPFHTQAPSCPPHSLSAANLATSSKAQPCPRSQPLPEVALVTPIGYCTLSRSAKITQHALKVCFRNVNVGSKHIKGLRKSFYYDKTQDANCPGNPLFEATKQHLDKS